MTLEVMFMPEMNMITRLFVGVFVLFVAGSAMAIEEPKYTVIEKSGAFELRAYSPKIVAETRVSGSLDKASSAGFRLIANYIFGNNTSRTGGSEKISMTAPVSMEQTGEQWRMHFVMPSQYTLESLPRPNNPAVTLREVPQGNYAVIRFSGLAGEDKVAAKTAELMAWLEGKGISPVGKPELARYNPPWTLPFFRRNEVMVAY
jgi:hypothetical protein